MYLEKCHGSWLSFILYNSKNLLTSHLRWDTVFGVTCAPGLWPLIFGSRINYLLFPLRWETRFVSAGAPLGKWGVWSVLGGETRDVGGPLKGSSYGCGHQVAAWRWFLASVTENGVLNFPWTRTRGTVCQCRQTVSVPPPLSHTWGKEHTVNAEVIGRNQSPSWANSKQGNSLKIYPVISNQLLQISLRNIQGYQNILLRERKQWTPTL